MACRLLSAKPLSKPMLAFCYLDPIANRLQGNLNQDTIMFVQVNVSENVTCKMICINGNQSMLRFQSLFSSNSTVDTVTEISHGNDASRGEGKHFINCSKGSVLFGV